MRWSVVDPAVNRDMVTWEREMASVTSASCLLLLLCVVLLSSSLVVPSSRHEHDALHSPMGQQQHHVTHVTPHAWHANLGAASGALPLRKGFEKG